MRKYRKYMCNCEAGEVTYSHIVHQPIIAFVVFVPSQSGNVPLTLRCGNATN